MCTRFRLYITIREYIPFDCAFGTIPLHCAAETILLEK
jgi:hypothetical protein